MLFEAGVLAGAGMPGGVVSYRDFRFFAAVTALLTAFLLFA
jgi:hypothetical protein